MEAFHDTETEALRLAKSLYFLRRRRDSSLGIKGLFGEPAWDILLDVFIAQMCNADIQVSSVCIEAGVPSTTVLRWIARLESEGMVYRAADNGDARRRYVRLTDAGHQKMVKTLNAIGAIK